MFCKTCGAEINENAVICPKCGCMVEKLPEALTTAALTHAVELVAAAVAIPVVVSTTAHFKYPLFVVVNVPCAFVNDAFNNNVTNIGVPV